MESGYLAWCQKWCWEIWCDCRFSGCY